MGTPQTPDSIKKSQQDKTPPPKPEDEPNRKLSNDEEGDRAEERQGGH
ncbi:MULTISPECIES: hypothetical protein [Luteimonas]|nr:MULTISPECIES: hypothetical protein [Luteimonas]